MQDPVSVDTAMARGHRLINVPVFIIMFTGIGGTLAVGILKLLPAWIFPVGIILSVVLAWLWWSVMITKWRLWAFSQVRNVHALKKRAIREKLIWEDKSVFGLTEIRSAAEREQWNRLQDRFQEKDLFEDNPAVPPETVIRYAKGANYMQTAIMLCCAGFGLYLMITKDDRVLGFFFFVIGSYISVRQFRKASNNTPQIILNDKGLETVTKGFYSWSEIRNEDVQTTGTGKYSHTYLNFDYPGGSESLEITEYDTDETTLSTLLSVYRGRCENSRPEQQVKTP